VVRPVLRSSPLTTLGPRPLARLVPSLLLALVAGLSGACTTSHPGELGPGGRYGVDLASGPDGRTRSYELRVPAAAPRGPLPLVVVLHGAFSDASGIERQSGWSELADEEGFLVVYPNGIGLLGMLQHWNAGHCCGKAMAEGVDDVGFVRRVVEDVASRWPVDRDRVYVTGFSNGAMLAHRVAAEAPETFAAVATVAGPAAGRSRPLDSWWKIPRPARPMPALLFFGKEDRTVPWQGRNQDPLRFPPALYSARLWAERNGCEHHPERSLARAGRIEILDFPDCQGGVRVEMQTLEGWGHRWPARFQTGRLEPDDPLYGFDATREIWRFFERFERPSPRVAAAPLD
jgi:polyhydroxybutyrate depolymerase